MDQSQSTSTPESLASRLVAMVNSYWITQALSVAAQFNLPDLLASGAQTSAQLAQATETQAPALHRLLRALVTLEIVREREDGAFALLPLGALLRSGAAVSLRSYAIFVGQYQWQEWSHLRDSVRTGESVREHLTGTAGPRPAVFNQAMVEQTRLIVAAVVQAYDFTGYKQIIDVGGGYGELLVAILKAYPEARGVLFDRPHVIEPARQYLASASLAQRCTCLAGDFFEAVPGGGEVYVLKSIIHNYSDEQSARILDNCRRVMPEGAKLLLLERIKPERLGVSAADQVYARADLNMLIVNASQERSAADYQALLASCGLRLTKIVPAGGEFSIMEATPV
jgi:ubiquinone/menaquinone biosynthesis C-methylase UbiE